MLQMNDNRLCTSFNANNCVQPGTNYDKLYNRINWSVFKQNSTQFFENFSDWLTGIFVANGPTVIGPHNCNDLFNYCYGMPISPVIGQGSVGFFKPKDITGYNGSHCDDINFVFRIPCLVGTGTHGPTDQQIFHIALHPKLAKNIIQHEVGQQGVTLRSRYACSFRKAKIGASSGAFHYKIDNIASPADKNANTCIETLSGPSNDNPLPYKCLHIANDGTFIPYNNDPANPASGLFVDNPPQAIVDVHRNELHLFIYNQFIDYFNQTILPLLPPPPGQSQQPSPANFAAAAPPAAAPPAAAPLGPKITIGPKITNKQRKRLEAAEKAKLPAKAILAAAKLAAEAAAERQRLAAEAAERQRLAAAAAEAEAARIAEAAEAAEVERQRLAEAAAEAEAARQRFAARQRLAAEAEEAAEVERQRLAAAEAARIAEAEEAAEVERQRLAAEAARVARKRKPEEHVGEVYKKFREEQEEDLGGGKKHKKSQKKPRKKASKSKRSKKAGKKTRKTRKSRKSKSHKK